MGGRDGGVEPLAVAGSPLGDGNQSGWSAHSLILEAGELLVACSDGAMSANACDARVATLLQELSGAGADSRTIADAVLAGTDARDDATVLVIKRT